MKTSLYRQLALRLTSVADENEARALARFILEEGFGISYADMVCGISEGVDSDLLDQMAKRLQQGEPVQHVVGHTLFCGRRFHVSPDVLIPRPETEELCLWVKETLEAERPKAPCQVLDIGTGSGCIAATLALDIPLAEVEACDISRAALDMAKDNADRLGAKIRFYQADILNTPQPESPYLSLIVSNPPYVCQHEKAAMEPHVLNHEPHTALFVPDEDPLLFYRAIARYGCAALHNGGHLFFEINPLFAGNMEKMLDEMGYFCIETRQDAYGKQRFTHAQKR